MQGSEGKLRSQGRSRRYLVLLIPVLVAVGFFALQSQVNSQADAFAAGLENRLSPVLNGDRAEDEFTIDVPVAILKISGESSRIVMEFIALGGLIRGDRVLDVSEGDARFSSVEVEGFFLPGPYTVNASKTDNPSALHILFSPR